MDKIKSVIFDMDGVLVDAKEWHYEALNRSLKLFGMEISRYDHLVTYDGLPTRMKLEMLSLEKALPRELHGFINSMKQRHTMEIVYTKCKPKFYHQYALAKLRNEGYRLAVCSNSVSQTVQVMMEKTELAKHLEFTLSNEDTVKPKPDPEMYVKAVARLGLKPSECLVLEDNEKGVRAAVASGTHVLRIHKVEDVTYSNIKSRIAELERKAK